MTWTNSKLGRQRDWNILRLALFEDAPGQWELCLYLRPGVTLGVTSGSVIPGHAPSDQVPRIAKIPFGGPFYLGRREAEEWAVQLAGKWLDEHLEELIAGKRFSV